jgi:LacI family transcriptional regulator
MVTSVDVARAAGVSQATVSRVLSGSPKVAPATRQRVLAALAETGYTPNLVARAMKTRRTGTIGVVVATITNPFYPHLIEALATALGEANYRMILWTTEGAGETSALQAIRQGVVDGLVFTTVTPESRPLVEALALGEPVVLVNRGVERVGCDQVRTDNVGGAVAMAAYLLRGGHRRIGLISGLASASTAVEREAGFRKGLAEHGAPMDETLFRRTDFSHEQGKAAMRELLSATSPPTAVFCVNDLTAFGAIDGARSLGLAVPEDVEVAGFDDIDMASWEGYDLTTVRQPIDEMAHSAIELLHARIRQPDRAPQQVTFPSNVVVRGSTAHRAFEAAG